MTELARLAGLGAVVVALVPMWPRPVRSLGSGAADDAAGRSGRSGPAGRRRRRVVSPPGASAPIRSAPTAATLVMVASAVVVGVSFHVAGAGPLGWLLGGVAIVVHRQRVAARRARADRAAVAAAAQVARLLSVAVAAGCGPVAAVLAVGARLPGSGADGLAGVARDLERGGTWVEALERWARCDPTIAPLAAVLAEGERTGTAVGPALAAVAGQLHRRHARSLAARARRLPVTTLGPLVVCVLPAFVAVTVVPMVVVGLGRLGRPP